MDLFIGEHHKENEINKSFKEEKRKHVKHEVNFFGYVSNLLQKINIQAMSQTILMMDFKELQSRKPKSTLDVRHLRVINTEDLHSKISSDLKDGKHQNNDDACSFNEILFDIRKLFVEKPREKLSSNLDFFPIDIIVDIRRLFQVDNDKR